MLKGLNTLTFKEGDIVRHFTGGTGEVHEAYPKVRIRWAVAGGHEKVSDDPEKWTMNGNGYLKTHWATEELTVIGHNETLYELMDRLGLNA
jgi:hypothetical protein